MSTIPSALSSVQTATFNGTSQYAGDLQQAINQAVAIASIPLTQLQSNVTTLQSQSAELSNLHTNFNSLLSAIQQLSSASGSGALAANLISASINPASGNSERSGHQCGIASNSARGYWARNSQYSLPDPIRLTILKSVPNKAI